MTHAQPTKLTTRQYAGAAIAFALAVVWVIYEVRGDVAPAGLGQALMLSLAIIAGGATDHGHTA